MVALRVPVAAAVATMPDVVVTPAVDAAEMLVELRQEPPPALPPFLLTEQTPLQPAEASVADVVEMAVGTIAMAGTTGAEPPPVALQPLRLPTMLPRATMPPVLLPVRPEAVVADLRQQSSRLVRVIWSR